LNEVLEDFERRKDVLPLIGFFSCLFCEQLFGTKLELKQHYCDNHQESIPDFGEKVSVFG